MGAEYEPQQKGVKMSAKRDSDVHIVRKKQKKHLLILDSIKLVLVRIE